MATLGTVAGSLLNLANPFNYINLIVSVPTLVLNTIQTIAETAHEVKYQAPVDAIKNITGTVTNTIGAIAAVASPGPIGNIVAGAANSIGNTIGDVAEAVASPTSVPEAVSTAASAIIQGSVIPIANAVLPAPAGAIVSSIAATVDSSILSITKLVSLVLGSKPQQLSVQQSSEDDASPAILAGRAGADTITGGDRGDLLLGEGGPDVIRGGNGNDTILAGSGDDAIFGDAGNDKLHGSTGDDQIHGGEGNDSLYGEVGNDALYGGAGNDKLYGGAGNDWLHGGEGADFLNGGTGDDIYILSGSDTLYEEGGDNDVAVFQDGDTLSNIARNGNNLDIFYGANEVVSIVDYFAEADHKVDYFAFGSGDDAIVVAADDLLADYGIAG
jgi:Ca2+-binding RTX toxin-like protein